MFNYLMYRVAQGLRGFGYQFHEERDVRVQKMREVIERVEGIKFHIENADDGTWVAESTNIDGIITGGNNYPDDVNIQIRDAIFTYFGIPSHLCNPTLVARENEASVEQRVYA